MRFCTVRVFCARETSPGWKQARKEIIPQITNGNAWLIFPTMTTLSPESNYTATKPTSLWHKCTCARCVHVWAVVIETVIVAGISKCLYFFSPSQSLPSLATPRLLTQIIVCRLVQGAKKCGRVGWQGRAHACVCPTLFLLLPTPRPSSVQYPPSTPSACSSSSSLSFSSSVVTRQNFTVF